MDFETFAAAELAATAKKLAEAAESRLALEVTAAVAAAQRQAETAMARTVADADALAARVRAEADEMIAAARANDGGLLEHEREKARAEIARVKAEADEQLAQVRIAGDAELAAVRAAAEAELAPLRSAADGAARTNASFGAMIEQLRADHTQLAAENERLAAEHAALTYEHADIVERARRSDRGPMLARLTDVFRRVAAAGSVDHVLAATASGLVDDFARVAVFAVRDNALIPAFYSGFDPHSGLDKVMVPLGVESLLTRALHRDHVHAVRGDVGDSAPFGGSPTVYVTASILVRGEALAVVYADDAGRPLDAEADSERVDLASVLRVHALMRLERLTIELKAISELRAYAQMLVDEVEYVYEADASSKKSEGERIERLAENLHCAEQIYSQRVTSEGPAAAELLEEVVVRAIERKGSQPFGRDLRTVHDRTSRPHSLRAAAQAS